MYSLLPSFVLGFHGCDRALGEDILAGKLFLNPSKNKYDWLGSGIYFWENSPDRALSYAKQLKSKPVRARSSIEEPFVIGAIIDLGYCLNLTDEKALLEVATAHDVLIGLLKYVREDIPINEQGFAGDIDLLLRKLDCAVFDTLHASRKDSHQKSYQSIRSPFLEGTELYPGTHFKKQTHIQICVRDKNCIKGYFRPLKLGGKPFQGLSSA